MKNPARFLLPVACVLLPFTALTLAQVNIEPPAPSAPATSPPATPTPTPAPATPTTLPSADSVLQGLLRDKPPTASVPQPAAPAPSQNQIDAVAPNEPAPVRRREGDFIENRTGRLIRDEKSGALLFSFDSDGKQMHDPPMGLVPSNLLALMEDASNNGNKPTKFKISAEITQYRGKNYLYVRVMKTVRDLNQGIGG